MMMEDEQEFNEEEMARQRGRSKNVTKRKRKQEKSGIIPDPIAPDPDLSQGQVPGLSLIFSNSGLSLAWGSVAEGAP